LVFRKDPISVLAEFSLNVSRLEQTARLLLNTIIWFHLDAPSSQAGARKPRGFDTRIGSRIKSQAKFQTATRRESPEDSMKRALLLIVVPALLIALGFAQTPAASINTDQTNIKGCLGGSDGNYTVVQDNTGQIFKITSGSVDLKAHLGHDVTLTGHKASGANSAADNFAVTELNMISEHCAAVAAAPIAVVSTPSGTASTPPPAADAAPAATTSTVAETAITPAVAAAPPAETVVVTPAVAAAPPAETVVITPAVAAAPPAETVVVTPAAAATPPVETVVTPAATVSTPSETVIMPSETASAPAARHRRQSATRAAAAAATTPDVTATPSETVVTPTAAAATPAATASTPAAADTTPTAPARSWTSWLLIPFVVLVLVLGTLFPLLSKWRKRKTLEARGAENLSFNREESSVKNKTDQGGPRKAA
jgi:hypothetical protein